VTDFTTSTALSRRGFSTTSVDVVYYFGAATEYYPQFYDPYEQSSADFSPSGTTMATFLGATVRSLDASCEISARLRPPHPRCGKSADDGYAAQLYWTLEAPAPRSSVIYTNVPEATTRTGATAWLVGELARRPKKGRSRGRCTPVLADTFHSERCDETMLDAALKSPVERRISSHGHVHNYRRSREKSIAPGAYMWQRERLLALHPMQRDTVSVAHPAPVAGEKSHARSYCDDRHGFCVSR